jgi:hypothetical protein
VDARSEHPRWRDQPSVTGWTYLERQNLAAPTQCHQAFLIGDKVTSRTPSVRIIEVTKRHADGRPSTGTKRKQTESGCRKGISVIHLSFVIR